MNERRLGRPAANQLLFFPGFDFNPAPGFFAALSSAAEGAAAGAAAAADPGAGGGLFDLPPLPLLGFPASAPPVGSADAGALAGADAGADALDPTALSEAGALALASFFFSLALFPPFGTSLDEAEAGEEDRACGAGSDASAFSSSSRATISASPSASASSLALSSDPEPCVFVKKTESGLSSTESMRAVIFTSPGAPAVKRIV